MIMIINNNITIITFVIIIIISIIIFYIHLLNITERVILRSHQPQKVIQTVKFNSLASPYLSVQHITLECEVLTTNRCLRRHVCNIIIDSVY